MVVRVANICAQVLAKKDVYVATESEQIMNVLHDFGVNGLLTSDNNLTGTDRVAEAATGIDADYYVNVQGDEPLILAEDISKIIETKHEIPERVVNGMTRFDPATNSPNIPKVVVNENMDLLYMSRALIPGSKSMRYDYETYRQVCIYAFTRDELRAFKTFGRKSRLEFIEDIEILRFLEMNIGIRMVEVSGSSLAVDVPEDVAMVVARLDNN